MNNDQVQHDVCTQVVGREWNTAFIRDVTLCSLAGVPTFQGTWCFQLTLKTGAAGSFEMLLHGVTSHKTTFIDPV
jgi:hypothetical protein